MARKTLHHYHYTIATSLHTLADVQTFFRSRPFYSKSTVTLIAKGGSDSALYSIKTRSALSALDAFKHVDIKFAFAASYAFDFTPLFDAGFAAGWNAAKAEPSTIVDAEVEHV